MTKILLHVPKRAKGFLMNNGIFEPCEVCKEVHTDSGPKREDTKDVIYGENNEDTLPLQRYPLKDGKTATEFLQKQLFDGEYSIYVLGLRLDDTGYQVVWSDEEIAVEVERCKVEAKKAEIRGKLLIGRRLVRTGKLMVRLLEKFSGTKDEGIVALTEKIETMFNELQVEAKAIHGVDVEAEGADALSSLSNIFEQLRSAVGAEVPEPEEPGPIDEVFAAPVEAEVD